MSNSKYKLKGLSLNLKKLPLPLLVDMTAVSVSPELHRAQVTILNILSVASNDIERGRDELRQLKDALGGGDDIPSIKMLEEYINDYKITDDMVRKAKELCDTSHDTDDITDSTNKMKSGVVVINDLQGLVYNMVRFTCSIAVHAVKTSSMKHVIITMTDVQLRMNSGTSLMWTSSKHYHNLCLWD
jgi:hypothetical protein